MDKIFAGVDVGRKNMVFGIALFLVLGVIVGIPLTVDFFGGSIFTRDQYQMWKVVHGYSVFLAFINYFFGMTIDRLNLTRGQKEFSSWSILITGLFGAVGRSILVLLSALSSFGLFASFGEVIFITLGTLVFVFGQVKQRV